MKIDPIRFFSIKTDLHLIIHHLIVFFFNRQNLFIEFCFVFQIKCVLYNFDRDLLIDVNYLSQFKHFLFIIFCVFNLVFELGLFEILASVLDLWVLQRFVEFEGFHGNYSILRTFHFSHSNFQSTLNISF